MAAITIRLTATCPGGNHLTMSISGDKTATKVVTLAELVDPITDEDAIGFLKVVIKMARIGRTNAQARALLQIGITVTV